MNLLCNKTTQLGIIWPRSSLVLIIRQTEFLELDDLIHVTNPTPEMCIRCEACVGAYYPALYNLADVHELADEIKDE